MVLILYPLYFHLISKLFPPYFQDISKLFPGNFQNLIFCRIFPLLSSYVLFYFQAMSKISVVVLAVGVWPGCVTVAPLKQRNAQTVGKPW